MYSARQRPAVYFQYLVYIIWKLDKCSVVAMHNGLDIAWVTKLILTFPSWVDTATALTGAFS